MNRTGTTQKRIEQVDGQTVLFLTVCSCLVSFLTTDLIGHAVFTFWLLLILCYFGLYKQGIGCYTVYLVTVVGLYLETKYSISFPSPLLLSMIYKLLLPAMPAYLLSVFPPASSRPVCGNCLSQPRLCWSWSSCYALLRRSSWRSEKFGRL